jgi:hypothetical protein
MERPVTPEGRVKKEILKFLRRQRKSYFFSIQDRFTAGIPDLIGVIQGRFVAIEVKRPGQTKSRPLQAVLIGILKRCGAVAGVAQSVEDVENLLKGEICLIQSGPLSKKS